MINQMSPPNKRNVTSVSRATAQLGILSIPQFCSKYILVQKLIAVGRSNSPFALALRKCICRALICESLIEEVPWEADWINKEQAFLIGQMLELGAVALSFYYPSLYKTALRRAEKRTQSIDQSLRELSGFSHQRLSALLVEELALPPIFGTQCFGSDLLIFAEPSGVF